MSLVLLTLGTSACQRVGMSGPQIAAVPTGAEPAEPVEGPPIHPTSLTPGDSPAPLVDIEVEGVDAILHSGVFSDPGVREATGFWINHWRSREGEVFQRYLDRMGTYETLVQEELEARALPSSLRFLPLVESGYSPRAVSRVGATGLWQLMRGTAGDLGVEVNTIVDERRDPVVATAAALDYLEELHDEFGSWLLALAAYNGGPGRLRRVLASRGLSGTSSSGTPSLASEEGHSIDQRHSADQRYLAVRRDLPAETREFVPRFLAAAALASDPGAYGFLVVEAEPWAVDVVHVGDATSLEVIAKAAEAPEETIRRLNPQYLRGYTPPGERRAVRVPAGSALRFEQRLALIPAEERLRFVEHLVAPGETFTHIARRYGVSVSELTDANRHLNPRRLQIRSAVIVPLSTRRQAQ